MPASRTRIAATTPTTLGRPKATQIAYASAATSTAMRTPITSAERPGGREVGRFGSDADPQDRVRVAIGLAGSHRPGRGLGHERGPAPDEMVLPAHRASGGSRKPSQRQPRPPGETALDGPI